MDQAQLVSLTDAELMRLRASIDAEILERDRAAATIIADKLTPDEKLLISKAASKVAAVSIIKIQFPQASLAQALMVVNRFWF